MKKVFGLSVWLFFMGCQTFPDPSLGLALAAESPKNEPPAPDKILDRVEIVKNLSAKIQQKQPLVVHIIVPLCDNEHQGIVPTTPSLGNGLNLKTNLYWATSGGAKKYFQTLKDWTVCYEQLGPEANILERVVFVKNDPRTKIYVVADAYRGDRMQAAVNDFLAALASERKLSLKIDPKTTINAAAAADLVMFNGHNGMMDDIRVKKWVNKTNKRTDAVVNACLSGSYMSQELIDAGAYPLIRTNSTLYPGAYVLAQIIEDWISLETDEQIRLNAGQAYCKKHKCGAGTKVFKTGW